MKKMIGLLIIPLILIAFSLKAYAGVPLDTIQAHVNDVLDVLRDPAFKDESAKDTKQQKIASIADAMFDFSELSKRTLGNEWKKLNKEQHREFIDLYRQILEKAYMGRIMEYSDEKVIFDKETMLSDNKAEVQSHIVTSSKEIPIFYRLIIKDGEWRVYDVIIEGVSLIKNYRSQFKDILSKRSPDELLKILREKVSEA